MSKNNTSKGVYLVLLQNCKKIQILLIILFVINPAQQLGLNSESSLNNNNQSVDTTDSCLKPYARNICIII